jgi:hypothetical protein
MSVVDVVFHALDPNGLPIISVCTPMVSAELLCQLNQQHTCKPSNQIVSPTNKHYFSFHS